jgi:hypothetical protein
MNSENENKIKYILTFLIPILVILGLFMGGIGTGIITFEQKQSGNLFKTIDESENRNAEEQSNFINATIMINFDSDTSYTRLFQLEENLTIFDFLLLVKEIGDINVSYTYWEQYDSYFIDSLTFNNNKYEGDINHFWALYINDISALEGANKIYVNENDIIKWEFTEI